jgi:ParB/RepB/Spo0J family partition protein
MTSLPLSAIWFDREARQRRDLGDLTDLMVSIREVGLINPIVVTKDGRLIAGERRYSACTELGWSAVPVTYLEELTPLQLEQVELDENIKRLELPWQDRVKAVERYVSVAKQLDPQCTLTDVADRLGVSGPYITQHLGVGALLATGHVGVTEAPKFSVARGIWERNEARAKASSLEEVTHIISDGQEVSLKKAEVGSVAVIDDELILIPILNADFNEFAHTRGEVQYNFIHCDFPYGIDADGHDQGAAKHFGGYADSEDIYWQLLDSLQAAMGNRVADSAHLVFWFSMKFYTETKLRLESMGWTVNPMPLIWHRSDNSGILPDPRRGPRQIYETAFLAHRGDRFIVRSKSNLFASPNTKLVHMSEKPLPVLDHFFQMFVDEHTVMLDPTCGSGNSVIAAERLGAKSALGLEISPEFHQLATENWKRNRKDE